MMKKLSILLLILCALTLPAAALAEICICGVELPDGYYMASGTNAPVTTQPDGGYAYLKDGVLTLNNYRAPADHEYDFIERINMPLEIRLIGENTLAYAYEGIGDDTISLFGSEPLTISGSGSLNVTSPYGIYSYDDAPVFITGGKITIRSTRGATIRAGRIEITGGDVLLDSPSAGTGLYGRDNVSILGGKIKITAADDAILADELIISGQDTVVDCTATEDSDGVFYIGDDLRIDSPLQILKPEGGKIGHFEGREIYTILDANGQLPSHVYIATPNPPTPTPAPTPTPTPVPVPQTGDHADLTLWLALAVLAVTGMVLLRRRAYR